jgi:hypothetical protein
MRLLLESTLALDGQFGSHLVGWAWAKMCCCRGIGLVSKVPNSQPPEYFANPNVALKRKTVCMRRTCATGNSWQCARAIWQPSGAAAGQPILNFIYLEAA